MTSAVRFVKSFRSDAGGLASLGRQGLSVRHRRTRFARSPIGVRRDRLSVRMDGTWTGKTDLLTHTIKSEDLTPFLRKLRNWSFRIKGVLNDQSGSVCKVLSVRRRRPRFARPPGAFGPTSADSLRSSADRGSSRSAFGSDGTGRTTHNQSSTERSVRFGW